MSKKIGKTFVFLCTLFVFTTGCSHYGKMVKSTNMDAKLDYAIDLYNKKQYYKALPLFEELVTVFRGTKKAEKTYYYYSYTNYKLEDYETAAYDFENFARTFPNSEFAEECAFMHAYCYYQDSPEFSLDQTSTIKAMNELQLFADRFPQSSKVEQCNTVIDQLRLKLENKAFENAKLYFHMDDFKAAVTSFRNILHDYPSGKFREESSFMIIRSWYQLAENSIETKKAERYSESLKAYGEFIANFPASKLRKDADDLSSKAHKRLDKINATEVTLKN
ncbi:MAG: outer membrane protein assembly factor BamD [Bacteroidetes bacterium]|nr:outer membrane protein assembly factor BamD [Bacteroidota bacterium]